MNTKRLIEEFTKAREQAKETNVITLVIERKDLTTIINALIALDVLCDHFAQLFVNIFNKR